MIPSDNSPLYFSFNDIIRNLREALGRKDARNLGRFVSSGYDVIDP